MRILERCDAYGTHTIGMWCPAHGTVDRACECGHLAEGHYYAGFELRWLHCIAHVDEAYAIIQGKRDCPCSEYTPAFKKVGDKVKGESPK